LKIAELIAGEGKNGEYSELMNEIVALRKEKKEGIVQNYKLA
jgi:hypothetical protein